MAEPESILQLGIEAAREGRKEEARQLFRLLTRQEPNNAQGWLWLAGVAENREERQNALEQVLIFEPTNEMALKGLHALGVQPSPGKNVPAASTPPTLTKDVAPSAPPPPPVAPPVSFDIDPFGDEDPFAELNNLSETMAADTSGPVRRAELAAESGSTDTSSASSKAASGSASGSRRADSSASSAASSRRAEPSRAASSSRRPEPSRASSSRRPADDEYESSSNPSPFMGLILFLVGLGLIALLVAFLFPGLFEPQPVVRVNLVQTAAARTAQATLAATSEPLGGGIERTPEPGLPATTAVAGLPATTAEAGLPGMTPAPSASNVPPAQPTVVPADVRGANPAIVNANTPLQSQGWIYDFNQPTYAAAIIGNLGQFSPKNGRFIVVLAFAINNTGTPQAIPGNFFVLKDAQGRVWEGRPEVSAAYVVPGQNADLAQTSPLPPDGITRSVPIVFDVAPDATDLVFFARSNPSQGWLVLRSV